MNSPSAVADFTLADRYQLREGRIYLSGLQALVRLPLDQRRRDNAAGLSTAAFISGYEGSPLAGYDLELSRQRALLEAHDIVFVPGLNEELAADAVQGSQLAVRQSDRQVDGVTGYWYAKAPGLDRATDALRHANLGGSSPTGGAVAFVGDDATAKSSTVPSASEAALAELGMPTLVPADPQEILDLGHHAVELSRFCGLWVGMKIATNVADASGTAIVDPERVRIVRPDNEVDGVAVVHLPTAAYVQPHLASLERTLWGARLDLARRYATANRINRIYAGGPADRIGLVAAGSTYLELRQALDSLNITPEVARSRGIRVLKLGMVFPLEPGVIDEFADGLSEIIVVEEKRPFLESAIKDLLYGRPAAPIVSGKRAPDGRGLLRSDSDLSAELIAAAITSRLADHPGSADRTVIAAALPARAAVPPPSVTRTPFFCSGCPHNRSTEVPDGALVGLGIGCHGLAMLLPPERGGNMTGLTQMGGEGAAWIGMAPFVKASHMFQNIGDGTFHHSGSLAVRAAVASGSNITFKLLYNSAVAMTGGQQAIGRMAVPELVRMLSAEGVAKIVITTDDTERYRNVDLAPGVRIADRDELLSIQKTLAATPGVTVLIHDQECASELRRKRKRGVAAEPVRRAFINERVCEGCGDCGKKSNCLSVHPVDTEYGRKTQIHQASCNKDFSCLDGDCPSFLSVIPAGQRRRATPTRVRPLEADELPDPEAQLSSEERFTMRIAGIGGTGVVTLAQIVATAAAIGGRHVRALDQTGLAQKGGAVVSDLKFSTDPRELSPRLASSECDLYLGCDLLVAASPINLAAASAERTAAIVSTSEVPTGGMVIDPGVHFPAPSATLARIAECTRPQTSRFVDSQAVTTDLFADNQFANMFLLGVAYQLGILPVSGELIERAIVLNGVAVDTNRQAFRRGRQSVSHPDAFRAAIGTCIDVGAAAEATGVKGASGGRSANGVADLIARRAAELADYQNTRYATRYREFLDRVAETERARLGDVSRVTEAVAGALFKLMAYKDEYEVARLSIDPMLERRIEQQFGPDARFSYRLHPPLLRALGMKRKLSVGVWFRTPLALLYRMRGLRGTRLDPFGRTEVRRTERLLADEYRDLVERSLIHLEPANADAVSEIASLPDMVRGYEEIKLASVAAYREAARLKYAELTRAVVGAPDGSSDA